MSASGYPSLGVEIVSGVADEAEVAALVAASMASVAANSAQRPARTRTGEWVLRSRCGGLAGSPFPGARSREWRWSLHP